MEKFSEGDIVVAVKISPLEGNDIAPPVEIGKSYTILKIVLDKKSNQHLDVGLPSKYNFIRSYETGENLPDGDKIHWCHPSRFIKKP